MEQPSFVALPLALHACCLAMPLVPLHFVTFYMTRPTAFALEGPPPSGVLVSQPSFMAHAMAWRCMLFALPCYLFYCTSQHCTWPDLLPSLSWLHLLPRPWAWSSPLCSRCRFLVLSTSYTLVVVTISCFPHTYPFLLERPPVSHERPLMHVVWLFPCCSTLSDYSS